ncbi:Retrograde regulation protein 2 [Lasiodiplodia theobromae]|uniref:Retrograde regulation protein 2 n=1 Tax=Lasiodiplodia theobromae TaxID=45133 RepID=UPI0015C35BC4|nr:Retrograde regulation protein 2 [Lasiodiplodia theobromae]KAF4535696.1 Retrograde regulation protein 2 [Lasiodiplodia theobromae]
MVNMAAYEAIVDMGSNGIRFSVTDTSPDTARCLPTVFSERLSVSLYDAQWKDGQRVPIPAETMNQVARAFRRFKTVCQDFGVDEGHVRVLATEATRTAPNSDDFMEKLHEATGWTVTLLKKEEEGLLGAHGIASSFDEVRGLCMDLGGGSTQLSWIYTESGQEKMLADLREAYGKLDLPAELTSLGARGNLNLYLSGGGFRGWGFALMHHHPDVQPYPIPIINGFCVPAATFRNTDAIVAAVGAPSEQAEPLKMHRVSERRASQIPAVANLVACVSEALPSDIRNVYFCQGGVREGRLFSDLNPLVRSQSPLVVATQRYASRGRVQRGSAAALANALTATIKMSNGPDLTSISMALANIMYEHSPVNKDIRAAAALQSPITGELAGAHGLSHTDRAHLAIALCERHGGRKDLDPVNVQQFDRLMQLVEPDKRWWLRYLGRVAAVFGIAYPSGMSTDADTRILLNRDPSSAKDDRIALVVSVSKDFLTDPLEDAIAKVEKMGKKKKWIAGEEGRKVDWKIQKNY